MPNIKRQIVVSKSVKRIKKVTEVFLETLYFASSVGEFLYSSKYSYLSCFRKGPFSDWSNSDISKRLYNMERVGYIKHDRKNKSIEFTNKAEIRIIDRIGKKCKADGKLRFISFDIPEQKRHIRDGFRKTIKRIGFKKVQKSLWVCNRNVSKLVETTIKEYKVNKYVTYIIAHKCDTDAFINKMFTRRKLTR